MQSTEISEEAAIIDVKRCKKAAGYRENRQHMEVIDEEKEF